MKQVLLDKHMKEKKIDTLRHHSRKLIRELGMLQFNKGKKTTSYWHALIEISKEPDMTISKLGNSLLISTSAMSRIVNTLIEDKLVAFREGSDKREKYLSLTEKGQHELHYIDEFSNEKIIGAFEFLSEEDQNHIISAIHKYGEALEKGRLMREQVKIHTLSTSRALRKQIMAMIETIQRNEFFIPISPDINDGILRAEEEYYYHNTSNFWYAIDDQGSVIGCIGLKKINVKEGEIKKFFVDQRYRGKGVAQKLMDVLFKAALKHNFETLYLGTTDKFLAAQRFYEKHGFSRISKEELPSEFVLCPVDSVFFKGKVRP